MDPVYLDYAATTPVREEVRLAMAPFLSRAFGNPSSAHRWGREAADALEAARSTVAAALGADPAEIRFVRGGTESDNLAVLGGCAAMAAEGDPVQLIVSAVEHPAVLEAARHAAGTGVARLSILPVTPGGSVDLEPALSAATRGSCLVSAMWVNNETGIVLPVPELARIARARGAVVHTDASQAVGKVPVDLSEAPVDMLTATGHKIHGPKGVGILFLRRGTQAAPLLFGGGQERALRPGTEDVAGAVGFATALDLAVREQASEAARLSALRGRLEARLTTESDGVRVNGGEAERAPHVASIGFEGVSDGHALVVGLDLEGIAVSGGSACASGSTKASHVISALYGADDAFATVRYSLGRDTTLADVDRAATATLEVVRRSRDA